MSVSSCSRASVTLSIVDQFRMIENSCTSSKDGAFDLIGAGVESKSSFAVVDIGHAVRYSSIFSSKLLRLKTCRSKTSKS